MIRTALLLFVFILSFSIQAQTDALNALDAGGYFTCGIKSSDSTIACWGDNSNGQLDNIPAGTFSKLAGGYYFACAIRTGDSSLACWGANGFGVASPPAGAFSDVTGGTSHACAIQSSDGSIVCWGSNNFGQRNKPDGVFTQIRAGGFHTCALKEDNTVACWGDNRHGQAVSPEGTYSQIGAGYWHNCAIKTSDSTLHCWGLGIQGQTTPPPDAFSQVDGGSFYTCGVRSADSTVACWGEQGPWSVDIPAGYFSRVSVGWAHACAVQYDSQIFCWGDNSNTQIMPKVSIVASNTQISENGGSTTITIDRGLAASYLYQPLTIDLNLSPTVPHPDYRIDATSITLPVGSPIGTISWNLSSKDDPFIEVDEMIIANPLVTNGILDSVPPVITIVDDDAGIGVTHSGGTTVVTEGGMGDSYTMSLSGTPAPGTVVTVMVTPDIQCDAGNGAGMTRYVNLSDVVTSTTVAVTAVDDSDDEGIHACTITNTVDNFNTSDIWDDLPVQSVVATVFDNAATANLLLNSGFEEDTNANNQPDNWTVKRLSKDRLRCDTTTRDATPYGNCAYVFTGTSLENALLSQLSTNVIDLTSGEVMNSGVYYKTSGAAPNLRITLRIYYLGLAAPDQVSATIKTPSTLAYVPVSLPSYTIRDGMMVSKVKLDFVNRGKSGKLYVDDASIMYPTMSPR